MKYLFTVLLKISILKSETKSNPNVFEEQELVLQCTCSSKEICKKNIIGLFSSMCNYDWYYIGKLIIQQLAWVCFRIWLIMHVKYESLIGMIRIAKFKGGGGIHIQSVGNGASIGGC